MTIQRPSHAALQDAIRLHLEPDIMWSTIPSVLDLIAHVALLARKLQEEVERLRDQVEFSLEHQASLTYICTMCRYAEEKLWRQSLIIRELVSCTTSRR